MHGACRWHLSTDGGVFVDAEEKCNRLSTERVPGVDARCQEVTFVHKMGIFCGRGREMQPPVHGEGAWCGCTVPGGDFCPQNGYLLWMERGALGSREGPVPPSLPQLPPFPLLLPLRGNLQYPYLQYLGGGGGDFYAAGNLEAGDADDFSGGIAQNHYIAFVQVLEFYVREVIGNLFAAAQSYW